MTTTEMYMLPPLPDMLEGEDPWPAPFSHLAGRLPVGWSFFPGDDPAVCSDCGATTDLFGLDGLWPEVGPDGSQLLEYGSWFEVECGACLVAGSGPRSGSHAHSVRFHERALFPPLAGVALGCGFKSRDLALRRS